MYPRVKRFLGGLWRAIRTASGDDAYERYLAHHALHHPGVTAMSPRAYYDEYQRQKWSGVNRCC